MLTGAKSQCVFDHARIPRVYSSAGFFSTSTMSAGSASVSPRDFLVVRLVELRLVVDAAGLALEVVADFALEVVARFGLPVSSALVFLWHAWPCWV